MKFLLLLDIWNSLVKNYHSNFSFEVSRDLNTFYRYLQTQTQILLSRSFPQRMMQQRLYCQKTMNSSMITISLIYFWESRNNTTEILLFEQLENKCININHIYRFKRYPTWNPEKAPFDFILNPWNLTAIQRKRKVKKKWGFIDIQQRSSKTGLNALSSHTHTISNKKRNYDFSLFQKLAHPVSIGQNLEKYFEQGKKNSKCHGWF